MEYYFLLRRERADMPRSIAAFYRKFLDPVVQTYREFGVAATYRPVNDIVTQDGRKISGTGAAGMEGMNVLVGNFIVDFNYEAMARCLRVIRREVPRQGPQDHV